jgi:ElaB/YqjD/DUF883 family membrane-anchored ribosome-binding protein
MEQQELGKVPSNVEEVPARTEAWRGAREKFNETLTGVSEQAKYAADYADETVRNNPWTSVGIGFGVGVVIGALITLAASRSSYSSYR